MSAARFELGARVVTSDGEHGIVTHRFEHTLIVGEPTYWLRIGELDKLSYRESELEPEPRPVVAP